MEELQALFMNGTAGIERGAVLIMEGLQVLFILTAQRGTVQIMEELQALFMNGTAVDHQCGTQGGSQGHQ
uniref:Uncharacterized protein n=1 Tax=Picea sitchensis TaxID=3332 RepID=D5AAG6_PICSI|nr:unknown [Picea sitchensis]